MIFNFNKELPHIYKIVETVNLRLKLNFPKKFYATFSISFNIKFNISKLKNFNYEKPLFSKLKKFSKLNWNSSGKLRKKKS